MTYPDVFDPLPYDLRSQRGSRAVTLLFVAFFAVILVRTAWVADGAFIDLRTVANFVAGYGLRWNVDERVQVFTSPLWVLLTALVDMAVRQPYLSVLLLSGVLSIAAVALLASLAVDATAAIVAIALLTFSKAFVEYSTSGFATPLASLLIAAFWYVHWKIDASRSRVWALSTIVGLTVLTDWMATLLLIPSLARTIRTAGRDDRPFAAAGLIPVLVWMLFAFIYYGSVLPNPLIASWHSGWTLRTTVGQGAAYLLDALDNDPLTVAAVLVAAALMRARTDLQPLAVGVGSYLIAMTVTGGDALSGRALATPLLIAAIIVSRYPWSRLRELAIVPVGVIAGLGFIAPRPAVTSDGAYGTDATAALARPWPGAESIVDPARAAIRDERWHVFPRMGLLTAGRNVPIPNTLQIELEVEHLLAAHRRVIADDRAGLFAYVVGPRLHLVESSGRTDALLARLHPSEKWQPGGVRRAIPDGYVESLESGLPATSDPGLNACVGKLSLLTRGALLDRERLAALASWKLGCDPAAPPLTARATRARY